MGRMLAWAGVAAGAVYLIYIGGGWWGIYASPLRIATMVIAAGTLATWAVVARRNPSWRPRSVLLPAIGACLGSLAIATVFSRVPRVSLEYLGYAIVLAALYLLLVRLFAHDFFRRRIATLASLLFAVSAALYIGQVLGGWIEWWGLVGSIGVPPLRPGFSGLTYNNPSAALTMVCLLAIPTAATFGSATRRGVALLVGILGSIGFIALVSGSRAGWLALALTSILGLVAWLSVREHRAIATGAARSALRSASGRAAAVVVVTGLAALVVIVAPIVLRRALEGGENLRIGYAMAAIRMFLESPIVGTGPGTWVIQRAAYTVAPETDYYIPHAHNLEVQTLAELGLVGVAAAIVLVGSIAWLLRGAARGADRDRRWWAWATGLGLGYFVLHQVLDFYVNMPAFLFAAALPIAYLDATAPSRPSWEGSLERLVTGRRWPARGFAAVVAIAVAGLLIQEVPASRHAQAVAFATGNDWAAADDPARDAAATDPEIGSYQFTAGLTASRAGDHAAAAAYFGRVAERDDLPEAWLNLAAEQASLGERVAAAASLDRALRSGNQRLAVTVAAADLAQRLGRSDLAVELLARAFIRSPTLAGDPWWADAPRSDLHAAAVEQSLLLTGDWQIALMAGDVDRARSLAGVGNVFGQTVIDAWQDDTLAAPLLDGCETHTQDVTWLTWCARVQGHHGKLGEASSFRERVSLINLSSGLEAGVIRVSPGGMVGGQLVGEPADLWATYTYRRPAPWDILVPSLVHLTLE